MDRFLISIAVLLVVPIIASSSSTCDPACDDNEVCVDAACECESGYEDIDGTCQDVNECVDDNPCDTTVGACFNYPEGSYTCTCPNGYTMDPDTYICDDIDECEAKCLDSGNCTNSAGSYDCDCNSGYEELQKGTCSDIDECETECHGDHEICVNSDGGYECTCDEGYENVESICTDIDECEDPDFCQGGVCENLAGTFNCSCNETFTLDDQTGICYSSQRQKNDSKNVGLIVGLVALVLVIISSALAVIALIIFKKKNRSEKNIHEKSDSADNLKMSTKEKKPDGNYAW